MLALCMLRDGTLVSGGKDRKLTSWDGNYQKIHMVEVRHCYVTSVKIGFKNVTIFLFVISFPVKY